jgi:site-specific DNA-cytosine methylase
VTTRENGDGNIVVDGKRRRRKTNHRPSGADEPAKTLTKNTHSDGALVVSSKHPPIDADEPATTVRGGGEGHAAPALLVHDRHPISRPDEPSFTITTKGDGRGAQGACVVAWPWDRPSTTVTTREAVPPPGHHPESGSILSMPGAVKLSERAAAILQGFPEDWVFSGDTKKARWAQIGQAMPPGLSHAVASSIAAWFGLGSKESAA